MDLADAQRAKLDRLCTKLGLQPSDQVVEVGTGWGGFAIHAASTYGCRVTTTTISDAQFRFAAKRVADAGLSDRVTVLDLDYRDLTGSYDKLVSIEMIEAVDWRQHDTFFRTCASLLRPHGLMALQAITMDDRSYARAKTGPDFIREHDLSRGVHPLAGGHHPLPPPVHTPGRGGPGGHRAHYVETLHRWYETSRSTGTRSQPSDSTSGSNACGTCISATARGRSPSGTSAMSR